MRKKVLFVLPHHKLELPEFKGHLGLLLRGLIVVIEEVAQRGLWIG